jgi:hypothetical protein
MRILLQDTTSQLFFRGGHFWTDCPEDAFDFCTLESLFDFVERRCLSNVQVVVSCDEPGRYEIVPLELPLPLPQPVSAPSYPLAFCI